MSLRIQGRAVVQTDTRNVEIREFDLPEPKGILTEVVRTNICGSDLHFWKGDFPYQGIMGHEAATRVVELWEDVDAVSRGEPLEEGDMVARCTSSRVGSVTPASPAGSPPA